MLTAKPEGGYARRLTSARQLGGAALRDIGHHTRSFAAVLARSWRATRNQPSLEGLDDHQLRDIGLVRCGAIQHATASLCWVGPCAWPLLVTGRGQ